MFDETDEALLRRFFRQKNRFFRAGERESKHLSNRITDLRGRMIVEHGTRYQILFKVPGGYLLNMDHAISGARKETLRRFVSNIAAEEGARLIPVSETAWREAAGVRRAKLVHRQNYECVFRVGRKYYLSGFDTQEDPPLYFLCRLPHGVGSVDRARDVLKPMSVITALKHGAEVRRQGDLFFIKVGRIEQHEGRDRTPRQLAAHIYGTNHIAQLSITLDSGVMLVTGDIVHKPPHRTPDHRPLRLNEWWIAARNTVPATALLA